MKLFTKAMRLRKGEEFSRVLNAKERIVGKYIIIDWASARGSSCRLGIAASKKFGNSPKRNRFKRIVREAFRLNRDALPPVDLVIRPRSLAREATSCLIEKELLTLTRHVLVQPRAAACC